MARAIAKEIRAASGGLKGVKAMGVLAHGRAQLSMNITDFEATPISQVHRKVASLAARHKAAIAEGEVIGLIPEAACERESEWMRQLVEFDEETKILERRLDASTGSGRRSSARRMRQCKRQQTGKIRSGRQGTDGGRKHEFGPRGRRIARQGARAGSNFGGCNC